MFYEIDTWAQSYKTSYGCNLGMFIISLSVSSWQDFPAQTIVRVYGQESTQEWSIWTFIHLGRLRPYSQTLDLADSACKGQTL